MKESGNRNKNKELQNLIYYSLINQLSKKLLEQQNQHMNHTEISEILPSNQDPEQHYIKQSPQINQTPLVSTHTYNQEPEQLIFESPLNPRIYYSKKIMKELLDERTKVCDFLKIKPSKKNKQEEAIYRQKVFKLINNLFSDAPVAIDQSCIVGIFDCGALYSFFSSDGRFIPQCKVCNCSVYLLTRNKISKVMCSNQRCKIKVIGEYMDTGGVKQSQSRRITQKSEVSHINGYSGSQRTLKSENQRVYTKQELAIIKKTAKKIIYQ